MTSWMTHRIRPTATKPYESPEMFPSCWFSNIFVFSTASFATFLCPFRIVSNRYSIGRYYFVFVCTSLVIFSLKRSLLLPLCHQWWKSADIQSVCVYVWRWQTNIPKNRGSNREKKKAYAIIKMISVWWCSLLFRFQSHFFSRRSFPFFFDSHFPTTPWPSLHAIRSDIWFWLPVLIARLHHIIIVNIGKE